MERKPRDPNVNKLVTWRLVSFAYLQIGMLQAIAGFYAYFTVLHGFGLRPMHLMGLDRYRVFNDQRTESKLRDAYYLWCFDPSVTDKCQYLPNFYNGTIPLNDQLTTPVPYYTNEEFVKWQNNGDEYAVQAKEYLVERSQEIHSTAPLTMKMLTKGNTESLTWMQFENTYWMSGDETNPNSLFGRFSLDSW
jgi:hypothetical protein